MPYFMFPEDTPPFVAPASPNVQSQPRCTLPETPMGMFSTQVSYDALQGMTRDPRLLLQSTPESTTVLPQTVIASSDDNVRNFILRSLQIHRIKNFRFRRFMQRNGTRPMGWIYRILVSYSRRQCFPLSRRCVCSGCVSDKFLIS